ncbi:MAG: outer membrane protein assembly factor BamD [Deltaproteobacteria bacterium]|nr:outer membrane protein assembly factor BamD [Deltaproteobacteria bacterium]
MKEHRYIFFDFFKPASLVALCLLTLFSVGLTGCKTVDYVKNFFGYGNPPPNLLGGDAAASLAGQAQERMEADDYAEAAKLWQQLRDQFPYETKLAMLAELRLGDAYFYNSKFIEAYAAYQTFVERHPDSDAVPYALYQQGMCNYKRINGIDHDPTPAVETIRSLANLVESYPDNKYSNMAKARIAEAQNILAGHEFYVGEFYFNRKDYAAAINRFVGLITLYPDSGYHQRAMNYIAEYRDMVARGEIEEGNQRPSEYNSPFTITDVTGTKY